MALVLASGSYHNPVNPVETVLVANSLATGQGFSNPYGCVTGPTTHLAPVYPFVLSLVYRLIAPGGRRELAIFLLSATAISLAYALLPWLAEQLQLDWRVGLLAGLIGAAVPSFFWVEVISEWDAPFSTLLLCIAIGKFAPLFGDFSTRKAVEAGIVWGVALLAAATFMSVLVALIIALVWTVAWQQRQGLARVVRPTVALVVPVVLVILPWTVRNYVVFRQFIPIRGNAGLQLHMSFNDNARATFDEGALTGAFVDHPHTTPQACQEFARFGEIEMNRRYEKEALGWIRANPRRSSELVLGHFIAFWRMPVPSPMKTVLSEVLTILGLAGLWLSFKRHAVAARVLGIVLLIYPLVYYLNFYDVRYRYPLHPLVLLLASIFLMEAAAKSGRFRWLNRA